MAKNNQKGSPMNGYLVLLRHTMDDLPIGLFATFDEAKAFATKHGPDPTDAEREVFHTDCSTPIYMCIVPFAAGFPVGITEVVDFTE